MRSAASTIGWGLFCACSWTWCIGLFLPAIMLDRHGWFGFAAFAIPNVVGCTLFGYVLNRERSAAMVSRAGGAMAWFSVATLAYHMFFVVYVARSFAPQTPLGSWLPTAAAIGVYAVGVLAATVPDRGWPYVSALVYAGSVVAFAIVAGGHPGFEIATVIDPAGLAWLTPALVLGFVFCPYLDLTFHRARQRAASRHAFGVFGAGFAVMIVFSCLIWRPERPLAIAAWAHLAGQCVFTVAAHARELMTSGRRPGAPPRGIGLALPVAAIALLPLAGLVLDTPRLGEDMYLRFLGLYGWVFPAFVVLFIGPGVRWAIERRTLLIYAALAIVFLPCLELGILHGLTWMMPLPIIGLLILKGLVPPESAQA